MNVTPRCVACRQVDLESRMIEIKPIELARKLRVYCVHKPEHCQSVRRGIIRAKEVVGDLTDLQSLYLSLEDHIPVIEPKDSSGWLITAAEANCTVNVEALKNLRLLARTLDAGLLIYPVEATGKDNWYSDLVSSELLWQERFEPIDSVEIVKPPRLLNTNQNPLRFARDPEMHSIIPFGKNRVKSKPYLDRSSATMYSMTTGVVTNPVSNTTTGAGFVSKDQHYLGAVYVPREGKPHMVPIASDGSIQTVLGEGLTVARGVSEPCFNVELLYLPDIHIETASLKVLDQLFIAATSFLPNQLVLGDLFNFEIGSHHNTLIKETLLRRQNKPSPLQTLKDTFAFLTVLSSYVERIIVTNSNHHEHLVKWVNAFYSKPQADLLSDHALLAYWLLHKCDGSEDFLETCLHQMGYDEVINSTTWLKPNQPYVVNGVHNGPHGHKGINGGGFNNKAFADAGIPVNHGHSHSASVVDTSFSVGCTGHQGYADGGWTTWSGSLCIQHTNGTRALYFIDLNGDS